MTSAKFYRRIILACLWFMFLMWIYGKDRKTQEEFDQQMEAELDGILNDPEIVAIKRRTAARLATPEGQLVQKAAQHRIALKEMKKLINRSFGNE